MGDHRTSRPKGGHLREEEFQSLLHPVLKFAGSQFLDEVFPGMKPDLVKIDTQGADFEILRSLMPALAPGVRVAIEFSPYHLDTNGTTMDEICGVLANFSAMYRIQPVPGSPYKLEPVTMEHLGEFFNKEKDVYKTHFDLVLLA